MKNISTGQKFWVNSFPFLHTRYHSILQGFFFFPSLFFSFVSFSLLLLNVSTLCLEVCTRVPVCISKQLTIISSLLSTEIIRIELNPPGLKARAFYPLSCLTSLRSREGSYSLLTWCTIDDVSFISLSSKWSHFQLFDPDMPKCLLSETTRLICPKILGYFYSCCFFK